MSVKRRGKYWSYRFEFAGQDVRVSTKTTSKTLAREAEKQHRRRLEEGYNGLSSQDKSRRVFTLSRAAESFLEEYRLRHSKTPNSYTFTKYCARHLADLLGNRMLIDINDEAILAYRAARQKEGASHRTINGEVLVLFQILGDIGDPVRLELRRQRNLKLREGDNIGRALTEKEEAAILEAARTPWNDPGELREQGTIRSRMIYPAIMVALNTAMRDGEIRNLQWSKIEFLVAAGVTDGGSTRTSTITVERSKTKEGTGRRIPINKELRQVLVEYREWYQENVAAPAGENFVFPYLQWDPKRSYRERHQWDPTRPVTTFKTAWTNVRKKAKVSIRFHDLRHTAISKFAQNPKASERAIMAIAGHVSRSMLARYSHIEDAAKIAVVEGISTPRAVGTPQEEKVTA